uniref:von Willebrand factor A domain containing 10, tandem duplicate 2 n=1 Tax=Neogobius melanostomus TaxID=47308 RepID=A0A8C6UA92_9GOBI
MAPSRSIVFLVLSLWGSVHSFQPLFTLNGKSTTHRDITRQAILRKTAEVCRDIAASEGRPFSLAIDNALTVEKVQSACSGNSTSVLSTVRFHTSIAIMYFSNALVDVVYALSEEHHFDDETFKGGREVLTTDVAAVKASVKLENYMAGRIILGRACHSLQDFYSHSNWVELGKTSPYSALITPDQNMTNLAGPDVATCRNCTNGDCANNLLPDLLQQGLLTSGYFNIFSSKKPAGKCSHGGSFDRTSKKDPIGGINKDTVSSSHGPLHQQAADLAVNATVELLENIRLAVGDTNFLRLMGLSQSTVLCFVIDTTGSMSDDIAEAKRVSFEIIDKKRGTQQEPSAYILVPFNDPSVGPLVLTTDADKFKAEINKLSASGGGDIPEMCLSGLQLALTAAPPSSEIFVFTDAPAKDADLKSTVSALIESTKSVVTFMLTDVLASRRRRSVPGQWARDGSSRAMNQVAAQLYRDLAKASGGQAIDVTKSDLSAATTVIEDSSTSAVVNVFQVVSNPGKPDKFNFTVDGSIKNMTIYITGTSSLTFNISSPSGASQSSSVSSGPLAAMTTAGNLRRLRLHSDNQTGLWEIDVNSNNPYSVKVIGQSSVNFIYNLVEPHEGTHGDYSLKEGRPLTGGNATVLVTVTSDAVKITEVTLYDSSGPTEVIGTLLPQDDGNILVTFTDIPAGDFVLRIKGGDSTGSRSTTNSFQRQASTQIKPSSISVTVTDVTRPVCDVVSTTGNCSSSVCSSSQWGLTANISDGVNGTGIDSLTVRQGNGTLNTSTSISGGVNITVASYSASCCSPSVELKIVDKVGNVRLCTGQVKAAAATTAAPANTTANSTAFGLHSVSVRHSLWCALLLPFFWW